MTILSMIAAILLVDSSGADEVIYVGILKWKSDSPPPPAKFYLHGFYFKFEDGTWSGLPVRQESAALAQAGASPVARVEVLGADANLPSLAVTRMAESPPHLAPEIERALSRPRTGREEPVLVTTSRTAASVNAAAWAELASAELQRLDPLGPSRVFAEIKRGCVARDDASASSNLRASDLRLEGGWVPRDRKRLLVGLTNTSCAAWPSDLDEPRRFERGWAFRDEGGRWHSVDLANLTLLQIGRFAGRTADQALFAGSCEGGEGCPFLLLTLDAAAKTVRTLTDGL